MTDPRFTRALPDSQSEIPLIVYDEAIARSAWAEYQSLCEEEKALRERRAAAHQRFLAAFTAGVQ